MAKYRKKPTVIDAEQFFLDKRLPFSNEGVCMLDKGRWYIETLEGRLHITNADWIAKGYSTKQGYHFWPIKPDYFEENYEKVED